ncbi:hypothetical protein [Chryseobacterium oryctis]|uniref:Baseplate J-like protein n=1 Tax=Chryseobacterium oryctis TaxID=2952618 RepID=A0ABT3HRN4_9FLAO|nr:hypothetical protein [Chryseobacterium oryctis]MCW3162450.1 hypothetical protein [Chryseobacterium oryctis]
MKNCSSSMSIHQGSGTTQNERLNPALLPDFFLLDERKEEDFILFVQKLSKYVDFYGEYNIKEGDWSDFFESESTSIIISIALWNVDTLQSNYESVKKEVQLNANPVDQKEILTRYFSAIANSFKDLADKVDSLDDSIIAKESLNGSIQIIQNQLKSIIDTEIIPSSDMVQLIQSYIYVKKVQQLFGLLSSWRKYAESAIDDQLNNYDKHHPHYALFLTFLKLLSFAKEKLNEFTKKHLDFYYKDVIRTENQAAKPDQVYLIIEPYKIDPFLLAKNTVFLAGKNTEGEKKYYASTTDQAINQIKLKNFSSYHLENNQYFKVSDLIPLNGAGDSFDAFRANKEEFKEGILIASPLFFLQSGERNIFLRFNNQNIDQNQFDFYITGEKKVIEITTKSFEKKNSNSSEKYIKLTIPDTEKAIVPYDSKKHPEIVVSTQFPVLKIVPKNKNVISSVSEINIEVKVNNFKSYTLESDSGNIDIKKPFYPFSEFPKNGNGFMVSSNEFFMKKETVAEFIAEMDTGFDFIEYLGTSNILSEGNITSKKKSVEQKKIADNITDMGYSMDFNELGVYYEPTYSLIGKYNWLNDKVKTFLLDKGKRIHYSDELSTIINNFSVKEYNFKDVATQHKIRIELNYPNYAGEKYMEDYITASTLIANQETGTFPYKPRIVEFTFNYHVQEILNPLSNADSDTELYIIQPFGYKRIQNEFLKFSTLNNLEGFMYLGFEKANPKDSFSFLIQLEEGTANPQLPPAIIKWEYLSLNQWESFEDNTIADETYSFTQSGIVAVNIPDFSATTNTLFAPDLFWIRVSVSNIQAVCRILGIHAQAVKAVLTDFEQKGTVYTEITPKETISKSFKVISGVKKIKQPYASFGGRTYEEDQNLYLRTSERLRHKNRAITSWDYEHILLQEFPDIYRVKTLNHYRYDSAQISNVSAGYVTIIPVAKSSPTENINWKPLLSLNKMQVIKEFLEKISSPHVRFNVKPPKAEKVEVSFNVKFHKKEGMDTRIYVQELIKTINSFLSPWAYDLEDADFAQSIEFSTMIKLIDNQYYVDYITDFTVTQYILDENYNIKGNPIKNLSKITPQTDFTLFVPTETHNIHEI